MYVAGGPHPNRRPAREILTRVQSGEIAACSSAEVLQEILYRYTAIQRGDLAHEVYDLFVALCPVILDVSVADTDRARDLLREIPGLSARDAVHAGVMLNHGIEEIASFDRDFDRIPLIQRVVR